MGWNCGTLLLLATLSFATAAKQQCESFDLMFVIDGSGSISATDFAEQIRFLYNIADEVDVTEDGVHIGLVQFSNDATLHIPLEGMSENTLLKKICPNGASSCKTCYQCGTQTSIVQQGVLSCCASPMNRGCCCAEDGACTIFQRLGSTFPSKALRIARQQLNQTTEAQQKRLRENVPRFVVLTADGGFDSSDVSATNAESDLLKNTLGATVIAVGVGSSVDSNQMKRVASGDQYYFTVSQFANITSFVGAILNVTCVPKPVGSKSNLNFLWFLILLPLGALAAACFFRRKQIAKALERAVPDKVEVPAAATNPPSTNPPPKKYQVAVGGYLWGGAGGAKRMSVDWGAKAAPDSAPKELDHRKERFYKDSVSGPSTVGAPPPNASGATEKINSPFMRALWCCCCPTCCCPDQCQVAGARACVRAESKCVIL